MLYEGKEKGSEKENDTEKDKKKKETNVLKDVSLLSILKSKINKQTKKPLDQP